MNKEKKEIKDEGVVFKFCFTITKKDYKFVLSTKRAWVVGVILMLIRFLPKIWQESPF